MDYLSDIEKQDIQRLQQQLQELRTHQPSGYLPFVESWIARDWLNRFFAVTEKELDKFLMESGPGIHDKKVVDVVQGVASGEEKVAPVVDRPPYVSMPQFPQIEGVSDYEPFEGKTRLVGLTGIGYLQRFKALLYASPVSPKMRSLGWIEEMEELGRLLEAEIKELEKEMNESAERREEREEIVKKFEEKKALLDSVRRVLEWREERLKKVAEGWREFIDRQKELSNPEAMKFLEKVGREGKNPHFNAALGEVLHRYDRLNQRAMQALGYLMNDEKADSFRASPEMDFDYLRRVCEQVPHSLPVADSFKNKGFQYAGKGSREESCHI